MLKRTVGRLKSVFPRDISFFDLFKQMGELQAEIALLFNEQVKKQGFGDQEYSRRAQLIEHKGDAITKKISHYLRDVFITPLDRDDIHRIAHKLDNVIDLIEDAIVRIEMYGIKETTDAITGFSELIKEASVNLTKVIHSVTAKDDNVLQVLIQEMRELERKADVLRKAEITRLYKELEDAKLICQHEKLIERLERIMDEYEEVVEIIDRVIVKST